MSASDSHQPTPVKHVMFNPVTPDVSPPTTNNSLSQHITPNTHQYSRNTAADTSNITSVDIQEMEQVRQHLQHMMKSMQGFNLDSDDEQRQSDTHDGDGFDNSMSSVDTAAFLQKLLPNSSPLEELKVHFSNKSQVPEGWPSTSHPTNGETRGYPQLSGKVDRGVAAENSLLKEHLERERFRRKHCEQQIQELHGKLLETQQELAVAVSSERKKDVMIEQLDKTLAKVVDGWKKHENEKVNVINTLKQEREMQEKSHKQQQEMLLQFEKELSQAVEALTKEQERASQAEKEKESFIAKQKSEREEILQMLSKEREKVKKAEEEKMEIIREKEQAQQRYLEAQDTIEQLSAKNKDLQRQFADLEEEFSETLREEKKNLDQERKISKDSHALISSLQKEVQRLEMDLDTTTREKESIRMEMSLMEARHEAARAKEETERQAELERQMNERLQELHAHMEKSDKNMREAHRKQIQEISSKHKEELQQQLERFHQDLKKKDAKLKTTSQEYEDRLYKTQEKLAELSNVRQLLENERENLTIRMQNMMQTHCEEALRVLGLTNKSPASSNMQLSELKSSVVSSFAGGKHPSPCVHQQTSAPDTTTNSYASVQKPVSLSTNHVQGYTTSIPQTNQIRGYDATPSISTNHKQGYDIAPSSVTNQMRGHEPRSITYNHTSITAPLTTGYPDHQESYMGRYAGSVADSNVSRGEFAMSDRSSMDFVPLKIVRDDHDDSSVISGLHQSPMPASMAGDTLQHTLLEQDLEETRMTATTPDHGHLGFQDNSLSGKLQEQEHRQAELNHYVSMLLKKSPGQPIDETSEDVPTGLHSIPRSDVQGPQHGVISPIKPATTGYPPQWHSTAGYPTRSYNTSFDSNVSSRDQSQRSGAQSSAIPAFTKSSVPTAFSTARDTSMTQVPTHPHTPPRRDRDPSNMGTDKLPSLTPRQMTQLSQLMGLMGEGTGPGLPSAEQLYGMLRSMQQRPTDDISPSQGTRDSGASKAKRSLDSSFPSKPPKQNSQAPSTNAHPGHVSSTLTKPTEASRARQSVGSTGSQKSGPSAQEARQSAKPPAARPCPSGKTEKSRNPKHSKLSNAWR
ncbi:centrobin isoform X2 [Nematostella vectensis]|uniref:centrobin isoform X2 n=1 Tax=Nematostella vectensis TaxID=45351 RepID=UPI00207798A9|nr:centrobin isoform X2 [Nematostella vectensis]